MWPLACSKGEGDGFARADACVSAGNTGALMALARYLLKTMDGIDRPAIAARPCPMQTGGFTTVLDLGRQCGLWPGAPAAVRGDGQSALVTSVTENESPRPWACSTSGEEVIKGSEVIKRAGELLRAADAAGQIRFHGNVEGNDIFKGTTDVVVCDGFVGNVAAQDGRRPGQHGQGAMLKDRVHGRRCADSKLSALLALPVLNRFQSRRWITGANSMGRPCLGLRGLGLQEPRFGRFAFAFERALERAYEAARHQSVGPRARTRGGTTLQAGAPLAETSE